LRDDFRAALKKLPDLERLLSRLHAHALARDRNAVMYTNVGRRKLETFLACLDGFAAAMRAVALFREGAAAAVDAEEEEEGAGAEEAGWRVRSPLLRALTRVGRRFPNLEPLLARFRAAFDHAQARRDGAITPAQGVVPEYDEAVGEKRRLEAELAANLAAVRARFRDNKIQYVHRGKEKYQMEIAAASLREREAPADFTLMSQTKTVRRFWSPTTRRLATELERAENRLEDARQDVMRRIFAQFCEQYDVWARVRHCARLRGVLCI
jgi:DNA mismatch repair protein MSH6